MSKQKSDLYPASLLEPEIKEGQSPAAHLKALRKEVENKAIESINWYISKKKFKSIASRFLRVLTILLTCIGGLFPILQGIDLPDIQLDAQYGYIALAIAATCMALDKFMGLSSSWVRYMTTSFTLQKDLAEFQTDWILMWSEVKSDTPTSAQHKKILHRIKAFRLKILTEIEQEIQLWTSEFQSNLAQLQMSTRAKLEFYQPGIIDLTVTNATCAKQGLNVVIDRLTVALMTSPQLQIGHIMPGQHKVTVHGIVNGQDIQASHIINMIPNGIVELKLSLPLDEQTSV
jgi:hypothetical protein